MHNPPSAAQATGNLFLDHLPASAMETLRPSLWRVEIKSGTIIYERDEVMDKVFFPANSILSVVLEMSDGDTAEVGIIGREGMSGLSIVLGTSLSQQRTVVQVPNGAHCIAAKDFSAAVEREPELKALALRYAQATITTTAQLSACNNLHPTNERCARWLLMAHDRVDTDLLLLTQEFLSQMLGVRRGSVTLAASTLQEAGFISYSRGHINIRSRAGLESATCQCYEDIERDWESVMGYTKRKVGPRSGSPELQATFRRDGVA